MRKFIDLKHRTTEYIPPSSYYEGNITLDMNYFDDLPIETLIQYITDITDGLVLDAIAEAKSFFACNVFILGDELGETDYELAIDKILARTRLDEQNDRGYLSVPPYMKNLNAPMLTLRNLGNSINYFTGVQIIVYFNGEEFDRLV